MANVAHHPLTNRHADDIVARWNGTAIRIDEFLGHAHLLSQRLPELPYVINLCTHRYRFLVGFCAAIIAGQCTLMPPNRQRDTLTSIAREYRGTYVLGGDRLAGFEHVSMDGAWDGEPMSDVPLIADDQLCAIAFTSGSTGDPKPNRKYWRTLRSGTESNAELFLDMRRATLDIVATVPPQHMWGLEMSILLPMLAAVTISTETPFFPRDIFDAVGRLPHPRALVSSPVHLDALLKSEFGNLDIDRIYTATAPMHSDLARQLEKRFSSFVIDVFGCSESGIIAARRPTNGQEWQLADAFKLREIEDGALIQADHLEETVRLHDRVELLDEGRFNLLGRDQDIINIAGKRGSLAELNRHLQTLPGVKDGVIFLPDPESKRLAGLVVAPGLQPSDILDRLRNSIEPAFLPRPLRMVSALPRQETGKLARQAILDLFASSVGASKPVTDDHDVPVQDE